MKGRKDQCYKAMRIFQQNYPEFFQQPIIQSFLQNREHWELVRQAICYPTRQNMQVVDEAFQTFYGNVKAIAYLSNVIRETMADYVEDPHLYQAIQTLTPKQQEILTHKYIRGLQNQEIANLFGDSPQNVSKLYKRTLGKLKNHLQKGARSL